MNVPEVIHGETCLVIVLEYAKGGELFSYVLEDFQKNASDERIAKLQMYQVSNTLRPYFTWIFCEDSGDYDHFRRFKNSYFYIEKWTFKIMCEVYYRAKPKFIHTGSEITITDT